MNFYNTLHNTVVASSENSVRVADQQFENISSATLLAKLHVVFGDKDGSYFLRTALKLNPEGRCLQRSDDNTETQARILVIDCDKRIDSNGEELGGAPDPEKVSQILRAHNIGHVLYGTYSHYVGNIGNRYRIIVVTKNPYNKEQLSPTVEEIIALINTNLDGDLLAYANENNTWSQPWYYPRKPTNSPIDNLYIEYLEGEGVDVIDTIKPPPLNKTEKRSSFSKDEISPIEAFNSQYRLADLLNQYGYKKVYDSKEHTRWLSPKSKSGQAGIIVFDCKFYSHHGSCPFNDGFCHDAFDLMRITEGLSETEAVKKVAQNTLAPDGRTVDEYNKKLFKSKNKTEALEEWPDPQQIKSELLPVEKLSKDLIPEPYRDFTFDVAERMQCPIDLVAIPLLTITSIVIGAGCGIKPRQNDTWVVIPNLWGCPVGRPGIMKSPAVGESIQFLDKLQNESKVAYDNKLKEYAGELKRYESRKKILEKEYERAYQYEIGLLKIRKTESPPFSQERIKNLLETLPEPPKPVWKRFKTNHTTIEKLNVSLSENPRGLLIFRDEIIGLLRTFDKIGHESDRAFYLESWNGNGSYDADTISRGNTCAENVCVALLGTTQPDKLLKYLYAATSGDNDGLIQRFQLMVYPDELLVWQLIDKKPNIEARNEVFEIIKNLSQMDFVSQGASKDEHDRFPCFRLNDQAQKTFNEWITDLEINKIRNQDLHPLLIEHLSKFRSLMPSLTLIFHLMERATSKASLSKLISEQNVDLACAWCDYLESHAKRIYGLIIDAGAQAASILADKIMRGKLKDKFTWRDVYRNRWTLLKKEDRSIFQEACEELIDLGWLRESETSQGKPVYLINPKIKKNNK